LIMFQTSWYYLVLYIMIKVYDFVRVNKGRNKIVKQWNATISEPKKGFVE